MEELSSDRDHKTCKPESIYYLVLSGKCMLTLNLHSLKKKPTKPHSHKCIKTLIFKKKFIFSDFWRMKSQTKVPFGIGGGGIW